MSEHQR